MEEKRSYPRHTCQVEVVFTTNDSGLYNCRCIGHNICAGGMNLILDGKLVEDQELSLSFLLPDEKTPFSMNAKVIWSQNLDQDKCHAGIEFENISVTDQTKIISFVVRNEPSIFFDDLPIIE